MALNRPPATCSSSSRTPGEAFAKVPLDRIRALQAEGFGLFEDFLKEVEGTDTLDGYTVTSYTNGTSSQVGDEGGWLRLAPHTSGQTDTGQQVQGAAVFEASSDTRLAFGCRLKATDGDKQNIVAGLAVNETDLPGNIVSSTADAIVFYVGGDGNIKYQCNTTAGGHTAVDSGSDLGDATAVILEFFVDGTGSCKFYVDGAEVGEVTSGIPADTAMKVSFANEATEDANNYLDVDYFYCYQWKK